MTGPDPAAIAKGLTKAQREAVNFRPEYGPTFGTIWAYDRTLKVLDRLRLLKDRSGGWAYLSPLGLAVRAHLENSHD